MIENAITETWGRGRDLRNSEMSTKCTAKSKESNHIETVWMFQ